MTHAPLAAHDPDLRGLRVLVLGLGRSGLAATRLAARAGAHVEVADARPESALGAAAIEARELGAAVHAGGHPAELLVTIDLVVLSPGVPLDVDIVRAARAHGVTVWGEVELAARFCHGRIVGITGSNGKSTVTSMVGTILRGAGIPGGTGGNLATPFADLLALDGPTAVHAVELSSFQLETIEALAPDVAAILNLSPDHLDRYPNLEAYADAKARLLEVQRPDAAAVLNADDDASRRFERARRGRAFHFSTRREVQRGAFLRRDALVLRLEAGRDQAILPSAELPLPGEHNVANALAAALCCALVGCSPEAIASGLRAYVPLPHRLELVRSIGGVRFFNDSKATNPDAASRALGAFPAGSVHLILGGKDKGADWGPVAQLLAHHARQVLLVGQATELLRARLLGLVPLVDCGTVGRAVEVAASAARSGDVVLLAPGCASFDQYKNFEERGEDFRRAVRALGPADGADA